MIFHSYVSLPEGTLCFWIATGAPWCPNGGELPGSLFHRDPLNSRILLCKLIFQPLETCVLIRGLELILSIHWSWRTTAPGHDSRGYCRDMIGSHTCVFWQHVWDLYLGNRFLTHSVPCITLKSTWKKQMHYWGPEKWLILVEGVQLCVCFQPYTWDGSDDGPPGQTRTPGAAFGQWLYGAWWPGHGVAGPRVGGLHEQLARICCHEVAWDMDFTLWIPLVI